MRKTVMTAILIIGMVQGAFARRLTIKGTVKDATSKKAAEYVNVVLQTADSAFVGGTVTDGKGDFLPDKVDAGDYLLVLSCVGYRTQCMAWDGIEQDVKFLSFLVWP